MTDRLFKTRFFRNRKRSIALIATMLLSALVVHTVTARAYYSLNSQTLQLVASMAVKAGAEYLPRDPQTAIRIASQMARHCGVASNEIVSADVSADDYTLTIRRSRKVPGYVSLLALGLPGRLINVTASGRRQKLTDWPGRKYRI